MKTPAKTTPRNGWCRRVGLRKRDNRALHLLGLVARVLGIPPPCAFNKCLRGADYVFASAGLENEVKIVCVAFVVLPGDLLPVRTRGAGVPVIQVQPVLLRNFQQQRTQQIFQQFADLLPERVAGRLSHDSNTYPCTQRRPSASGTRCLRFFHLTLRSLSFSKRALSNPAASASLPIQSMTGT